MAKGMTYTLTDSAGNEHKRYSIRHMAQIYTHAVVRHPKGSTFVPKRHVSFHTSHELALKEQARERACLSGMKWDAVNRKYRPTADSKPYWALVDLIPVTATPGNV